MMILMLKLISNYQCNGTNNTGTIIATIVAATTSTTTANANNNPTATATLEWPHGLP